MSTKTFGSLQQRLTHKAELMPLVNGVNRFMALNDLMTECSKPNFSLDANTEDKLVTQVLALANDTNVSSLLRSVSS